MTKTPTTTIAIHKAVNEELKKLKKFWRETPNDVIARLIQEHKEAEAWPDWKKLLAAKAK